MAEPLLAFKKEGVAAFSEWLLAGASGIIPPDLLRDPAYAHTFEDVTIEQRVFRDRFDFGTYLTQAFQAFDKPTIAYMQGLWTWLAAYYFEQLCPRNPEGQRTLRRRHAYVLDARQYFRHLIQMPWYLVSTHGETAKFLLTSISSRDPAPLSRQSYILDQLASRQFVISSPTLVGAARRLYSDPNTGKPTRGAGARGRGSPRRLAIIANQLSLTYDIRDMSIDRFLELLPNEFH
jgi:hypothetical protein